jgi:hypothetical protein
VAMVSLFPSYQKPFPLRICGKYYSAASAERWSRPTSILVIFSTETCPPSVLFKH